MVDYKKKYLKYKKKYLEIKKFRGGADQYLQGIKSFFQAHTREEGARRGEQNYQEKYGANHRETHGNIFSPGKPLLEKQQEQINKWAHLVQIAEHCEPEDEVFTDLEECQKEVERLRELLTEKEIGGEELTPPKI
mgnify:CR=1 FL=1